MPHVKRLQNQNLSKTAATLGLNRVEVLNEEGLGPISARTSHGEPWELYDGGTAGLDSK